MRGVGVNGERIRVREHAQRNCPITQGTSDIGYHFSSGWGETQGIADRTDYDLKAYIEFSGESPAYFDDQSIEIL